LLLARILKFETLQRTRPEAGGSSANGSFIYSSLNNRKGKRRPILPGKTCRDDDTSPAECKLEEREDGELWDGWQGHLRGREGERESGTEREIYLRSR
jgi:hypothetical protein